MNPPMRTAEEMRLVKEAILLPVMMQAIDGDVGKIRAARLQLDYLLVRALKQVQRDMLREHLEAKRQLRLRGIRVVAERQGQAGIEADYLCRGHRHHMSLRWEFIQAETLRKVSEYTGVPLTDG